MRMLRQVLTLLMLAALAACTSVPEPDTRYNQVRPLEFDGELLLPGGELVEDKYLRDFFKKADYVLLGESHTNMTDHLSQAAILEKMAKRRLKPVLAMEFVDVDSQPTLDRFNRGEISVDQLAETLNWDRTVGYSFELYRPIFETAQNYKIPVYALNIPRRVVREARLNGLDKIPEKDKKYLPGLLIPASDEQRAYLLKFFEEHMDATQGGALSGKDAAAAMPGRGSAASMPQSMRGPAAAPGPDDQARQAARAKSIDGFITAQAVWDSAMAERAVRIHQASKRPVVIIVGQGHVEYGWGIAMRLKSYEPGAQVLTVLPWRAPMESVFMQKQRSPLLDSVLPPVFPPPDLADAYYYSPLSPLGLAPQGLVVGLNPNARRQQLMVLSVFPESAAGKAGFQAGDIILQVDRRGVSSSEEFFSILARAAAYGTGHSITLQRGAEKLSLTLPAWTH